MDDALLTRCRNGDHEAMAALFNQHKRLVHKAAFLILGDADQADDALQEVFIKVFAALRSYDARKGAFTTWLYRITVNYCLNQRRRPGRTVSLDGSPSIADRLHSPGPETFLADDELVAAIGRLSDKVRVVIVLRFYADLAYDEIAAILEIPLGTVKSRLSAGLSGLRGYLVVSNAHDVRVSAQSLEEVLP